MSWRRAHTLFFASSLLVLAACPTSDAPPDDTDAGKLPDAGARCDTDDDCDDDVYCNGEELCLPRSPAADARGCARDGATPCTATGQTCDEDEARCVTDCAIDGDADHDGVDATDCGGEDCDDSDPDRHPGATEVCDDDGVDEDCDASTFGERDEDDDGYFDGACCNGAACGDDCDDARATVHPDEAEACNGVDEDCDDLVDEEVLHEYVVDADRDGHGSDATGAATAMACEAPAGYASIADDCDDATGSVHPGAYDRCDVGNVDDDCSGTPNDPAGGCACADGASRGCPLPGACGTSTQTCVAGLWAACAVMATDEICGDGIDQDCDGAADDGCVCAEEHRFCGSDEGVCMRGLQLCASDGAWGPCLGSVDGGPETCDGEDEDCDGEVDEGVFVRCWADPDGDGYASGAATLTELCQATCPANTTPRDPTAVTERDCDETNAAVHPRSGGAGVPRANGSFDYDCDGAEVRVDTPVGACVPNSSGRCLHTGGLVSTGACGARVDWIACADVNHGSSGSTCDEVFRCAWTDTTSCGDMNQVRCR